MTHRLSGLIKNPERELRIFGWYALFYIFASFCTGLLIRAYPLPILGATSFTQDLWYAVLFKVTFLLAIPFAIYRRLGYRLQDLPASQKWNIRSVTILILSFLAGNILNLIHLDLIAEVLPNYNRFEIAMRFAAGSVLAFTTAGFPEEFVYRGILQTRIEALWGRLAAILIANMLFTAWHIPTRYLLAQGIEGEAGNLGSVLLGTGIPVFFVGLIFSLLWDRYRKFWPLVMAHWGIDTLPSISSLFGISR
jgi:membrane protease YdiL (CAAX protease family)